MGWDAPRWAAQAEELDAILHAGAQVNWLMLYGQLRRVNVLGTDALLELAGGGRGAALHLVSTISTAPADADEDGALAPEVALRSSGYGLSKWVAEQRARQAAARGLALTVHRPAMITGHSTRGVANPDDFVNRALRTFLQLGVGLDLEDARCDLTPVDWVAEAIVALVLGEPAAGQVSHLNRYPESPSWRALSQALECARCPTRRCARRCSRPATPRRWRACAGSSARGLPAAHGPPGRRGAPAQGCRRWGSRSRLRAWSWSRCIAASGAARSVPSGADHR
ncbi:MAG: SDR family oxidoreductase [Planctomycetota bacterium]